MTSSNETVVAVILNWNNYDDTSSCIECLLSIGYAELDILVVDNGSTDKSDQKIESEYPMVTVSRTNKNLGFAGGMNAGIQIALQQDPAYIWLLNNDVVIKDSKILDKLTSKLDNNITIGAVSPLIKSYPKTNDIWFWKGYIDWNSGKAHHQNPPIINQKEISNEYLPICCALFPSEIFEEVGLLPEIYFLYYEDVDYCTRIRNNEYKLITDTDSVVYHKRGGSTGDRHSRTSTYYNTRNQLLFIQEFKDRISPLYPLWYMKDLVWESTLRLYNKRYKSLHSLYQGAVDGLRQVKGKGPYP
ncbi:glycosyltransferase family 2 protein [Natrinema versiforme]|uniref:Putative glycosyltransferase n=1 Tax=Natrinema versiforme JCM 10478 TaxID=1227496 RepID=L9XPX5_9EURY|nr:glycosyltransferase family 2 protein [Natrinema versiforme]ELY63476.1 putative glycosyltransferase [Natrinema versiforme JCM 10478]